MDRNEAISREEAVRTISRISGGSVSYAEDLYDSFFPKPVVPQFVADWIKYCKFTNVNLGRALFISDIDFYNYESQEDCSKLKEFLGTETNQETFALAWTLGYEVEEEKRYTVRIKGIEGYSKYLNRDTKTQTWLFASETELERFRAHHTRKELEDAGFGWVFSCEGVEVKEVE
jgi:hypothetical protein